MIISTTARGKILLKNARLITMKGDEIIALGEILIENNGMKKGDLGGTFLFI